MTNFAVIGVGRMGTVHAMNLYFRRVRGARLYAVCDTDPSALAKAAKRFPRAKRFADVEALLADGKVEAVVIATPHYAHADIAVACLEKGVHVLVEKPLSVTAADARRVIDASKRNPKTVAAVMLNQRTNPLYKRARRLVRSGKLGEIQRAQFVVTGWYRSQAYYNQGGWRASICGEGGGTLINQCVHQLDIMQWVLGMPDTVSAEMFTKGRDIFTENDVTAVFGYGRDVRCAFFASTHELHGTDRFEIIGTHGKIVIENLRMTVEMFRKDEREVNAETVKGYGHTGGYKLRYGHKAGFVLGILKGGQQKNILVNFAAAIAGRQNLISPIEDGLASVEIINAVYAGGWTGKKVEIPFDAEEYKALLNEKREEEIAAKAHADYAADTDNKEVAK